MVTMPTDGAIGVAVVGEDEVHRALAMALFDGALATLAAERGADWLVVDDARTWLVFDGGERVRRGFYDSHREDPLPTRPGRRIRTTGHINGRPAGPGAAKLRRLFTYHALQPEPPGMVVLLTDTDGDERTAASAEQVRELVTGLEDPPALVIGMPHRDAEAWLFAAALPTDAQTAERLAAARKALSFDPSREPERLTSSPNDAMTDAKRVLRFVLLHEGEELARGRPRTGPPTPDEADEIAERLARDLDRASTFRNCGLSDFVRDLRAAVATTFRDHVPPAAP